MALSPMFRADVSPRVARRSIVLSLTFQADVAQAVRADVS